MGSTHPGGTQDGSKRIIFDVQILGRFHIIYGPDVLNEKLVIMNNVGW